MNSSPFATSAGASALRVPRSILKTVSGASRVRECLPVEVHSRPARCVYEALLARKRDGGREDVADESDESE